MSKDILKDINKRIKVTSEKAQRDVNDVKLICVTKGVDAYRINEAIIYGITDIGENKVQEAITKKPEVMPGIKWHLIGHLQTNKVKEAIKIFDLIHSVDSVKLAQKINKEAKLAEKVIDILIQVNVSGEESKYGISQEGIQSFLNEISALGNLKILGLMTITPLSDNPEDVRPYLKKLKEIFEKVKNEINLPNVEMKYLSMGMSQDFEVAIEEGANMLRIGTAIFGRK